LRLFREARLALAEWRGASVLSAPQVEGAEAASAAGRGPEWHLMGDRPFGLPLRHATGRPPAKLVGLRPPSDIAGGHPRPAARRRGGRQIGATPALDLLLCYVMVVQKKAGALRKCGFVFKGSALLC
jgi:hypothetical protein